MPRVGEGDNFWISLLKNHILLRMELWGIWLVKLVSFFTLVDLEKYAKKMEKKELRARSKTMKAVKKSDKAMMVGCWMEVHSNDYDWVDEISSAGRTRHSKVTKDNITHLSWDCFTSICRRNLKQTLWHNIQSIRLMEHGIDIRRAAQSEWPSHQLHRRRRQTSERNSLSSSMTAPPRKNSPSWVSFKVWDGLFFFKKKLLCVFWMLYWAYHLDQMEFNLVFVWSYLNPRGGYSVFPYNIIV